MSTPIIKIFRPVAIGTDDTWGLFRGADKIQAVDPGDPVSHDEKGSCIQAADIATRQSYRIDRNFPDKMGTINEVRVFCRYNPQLTSTSKVKVGVALTGGPTWVESADLSHGGWNWDDVSAALARPGGGGWTEADLRDTTFQFAVKLGTGLLWVRNTSLWLKVNYDPTDESAGAIPPEFPSRKLRRSRLPAGVMSAELRGDALNIDLLKDFEVSHSQGEKFGGGGWGEEEWERRHFRCFDEDLELNKLTVRMKAFDLHDYTCMFWHTGISPYNVKSDEYYPDGPAVLHPGVAESFTRVSKAWILDASNRVARLNNNIKRIGPDGILLEGAAINHVINSSFFNGMTSWSLGGGGGNALDPNETLFADEVASGFGGTNQSLKLTYVDGSGARYAEQATGQAFNNQELIALTIWRKDGDANFPGRYIIQNTVTGNYYDAGAQTWDAQFTANYLPSQVGEFGRFVVVFLNDVSTSTLAIQIRSPYSPAEGNKFTHFTHVQLEWFPDGQSAGTSPIPTWTAAATRYAEPPLTFTNNVGRRVWPVKRGTAILRLKWYWGGSPVAGGIPPDWEDRWGIALLVLEHDADNWAYIHWYFPSTIRFSIKAAGVIRHAEFLSHTIVNEATDVIVARWTSGSGGELDLPARTMNVFVNGVKGATEVQASGDMVEVDSGSLFRWGYGLNGFGGGTLIPEPLAAYSHVEVLPWCLTDEEIKARP